MSNPVVMTYGDYTFSPVPLISYNKEYQFNADDTPVGVVHSFTLQGVLTVLPSGELGYKNIDTLQDELREALSVDCKLFQVVCGSDTLVSTVPTVRNISFSPSSDNWVITSPYTVELQSHEEPYSDGEDESLNDPKLKSQSETWDIEFDDSRAYYNLDLNGTGDENSYVMRLTHNVSAVGQRHCTYGELPDNPGNTGAYLVKEAWEQARDWVIPRLGYSDQAFTLIDRDLSYSTVASGSINIIPTGFGLYDHIRTQNINETDGSYGVTETWLVINATGTGVVAPNALEDFNITVRSSLEGPFTSIGIEGSIQGLETRDYGTNSGDFVITETKYDAALSYWNGVYSKLYPRAQKMGDVSATRSINSIPLNSSVAHNPAQGSISYSLEFDDRPCNFISGALTENITITDNNPTDVFASLTVLGRARGPVLHEIGTVTAGTRDANIEVVMQPPDGCGDIASHISASPKSDVETLLCSIEQTLTGAYSQVFKSGDSESWNVKNGRYTRQVTWTYTSCTGDAPESSFCS